MHVEYPLMELSPTRIGAEEAEFVCRNQTLFFDITVILPLPLDGPTHPTITFSHRRYLGQDVRQLRKFLDALAALRAGGEMQIFDLAAENVFATIGGANLGEESAADAHFREVVSDLARIAERFHLELRLPAELSDEDLESILLLKTLIEGGTLPIENISAVVLKSEENRNLLPQMLTEAGGLLRLEHPRCEPMPILLGQSVDTGPYGLEAEIQINHPSQSPAARPIPQSSRHFPGALGSRTKYPRSNALDLLSAAPLPSESRSHVFRHRPEPAECGTSLALVAEMMSRAFSSSPFFPSRY
ncbi:MAG: hypothetical protein WCA91_18215 [Candidatus Acidiferrales bacterium]